MWMQVEVVKCAHTPILRDGRKENNINHVFQSLWKNKEKNKISPMDSACPVSMQYVQDKSETKLLSCIFINQLLYICLSFVCVYNHMHDKTHVWSEDNLQAFRVSSPLTCRRQKTTSGVGSLPLPCESWRSNSGLLFDPLSTGLPHWPKSFKF